MRHARWHASCDCVSCRRHRTRTTYASCIAAHRPDRRLREYTGAPSSHDIDVITRYGCRVLAGLQLRHRLAELQRRMQMLRTLVSASAMQGTRHCLDVERSFDLLQCLGVLWPLAAHLPLAHPSPVPLQLCPSAESHDTTIRHGPHGPSGPLSHPTGPHGWYRGSAEYRPVPSRTETVP